MIVGENSNNHIFITNSSVTGTYNVSALVGCNCDDDASEITFRNCSVKDTKVEAIVTTRTDDKAGASAFLGMVLQVKVNGVGVNLVFEGTNVSEGNTLATADGYQGGGIYAISAWCESTWTTPAVVNDFTNYNSNN
ncbi:MAG: hypothetical protein IJX67_02145 [Oscillospiraceae bacterium]|nr:hypothetical protein [Oscillospiraceae bacterium]